jgi:pimeloyl-ACP methyl ester carboxylesterase
MAPGGNGGDDYREATFTSQDNLRLYFRDYGSADSERIPLLCLPGLTRNSHDFEGVAERYALERRVICPDYRGRGRSAYDPDWRNYQPGIYLNDLRHLLAALNVHRVVAIGTSMGGLLTMGLAVVMPTVLAGAVINDVGPAIDPEGLRRIVDYVGRDHPADDWDEAVAMLKTMMQSPPTQDEDVWLDVARGSYRRGADGRLHVDWDTTIVKPLLQGGSEEYDLWRMFRALAGRPLLAIRGALSDVLSEATFERMAQEIPDLRRATVPGVGHAPTLSEKEAVLALDAFLETL